MFAWIPIEISQASGKILDKRGWSGVKEVLGEFTGQTIGVTLFERTESIDRIWVTLDMVVTIACVMPADIAVDEHHLFVPDFLTASIIGLRPIKSI